MSNVVCTSLNSRKKGVILTYATLLIKNVGNLLITPLLIGSLGYSHYGIYIIAQSLVAMILLFDFGLTSTTEKYISSYRVNKNRENLESIFKTIFTLYIFVVFVVLIGGAIVYSQISGMYQQTLSIEEQNLLKTLLAIMFISMGFSLMGSCYNGILVAHEKFTFLRVLDIVGNFVRFVLIIFLLLMGYKAISVVIVDVCFNVSINALKMIMGKKVINIPLSFGISNREVVRPIIKYAWFIFLATIAGQIYWKIDNLILSFLGSTSWVTINGVSTQIIMVFIAFSSAIVNVFFPKIVKLVDTNADGRTLTDEMIKVGRMQAFIIGLLFCGVILFGRKFVLLWVGEGCIEAYYIVLAMLLPLSILMVQNLGIYILQAKNLHRFRSLIMFAMAVVNVVLTIIFVKAWGVVGAGIATGIGLFIGNVLCLNIYYHKAAGLNIIRFFKELLKGIGKALLICMASGYVIVISFKSITTAALTVQIILFTAVYIMVFYFVGINAREKEYLMEILREIKSLFRANPTAVNQDIANQLAKHNCCGCTACQHICPKNCITMVSDEEGFKYPKADKERCINCGKCQMVCPLKVNHESHKLECYAAWHKDEGIRFNSSSGGAFSAFAEIIIKIGGWVYGAAMDKRIKCYHKGINTADDLSLLRCSKYVQSDMNDVMPRIKQKLDMNEWVLFSGTPCQAAGLHSYLGKEYENLLTIDIVCLGVPSPKVFADYIKDMEQSENNKIERYQFRYKKEGWSKSSCRLTFKNGTEKIIPLNDDSYCRGFLKKFFLRPSCYKCMLKAPCSKADITLGDFWGIEKVDKSLFSQDGVSLVICHTSKGKRWLKLASEKLEIYPQNAADAVYENTHILKSAAEPKNKEKFWNDYKRYGYKYIRRKYLKAPSKLIRKTYNLLKSAINLIRNKV